MLALCLALLQGDLKTLCEDFVKGCKDRDFGAIVLKVGELQKADHPDAVEALIRGYVHMADHVDDLWKEKEKLLRKMNSASWRVDNKTGKRSGSYDAWSEAEQASQKIEGDLKDCRGLQGNIVVALRAARNETSVESMLKRLAAEKDWRVRACLSEVLSNSSRDDVLQALWDRLIAEDEPTIRVILLDTLTAIGSRPSREDAVHALVEMTRNAENPWQIRIGAAKLLQKWNVREAVPEIIEALAASSGRLAWEYNDVLKALTGIDKQCNVEAWDAWWKRFGEEFLGGKYRPGAGQNADPLATVTFYDIPIKSDRVVFILDRSGSMEEESRWREMVETGSSDSGIRLDGQRKIDVARYNLKKALAALKDQAKTDGNDVYFNVIVYNHEIDTFAPRLQLLTDSSFERACSFVNRQKPMGMTNIHDAIEAGLSLGVDGANPRIATGKDVEPDTIFLLSDGMPTAGQIVAPGLIQSKFKERNKVCKMIVNTVYVGLSNTNEERQGHGFMQNLAAQHRGTFKSPPPER